MPLIPKIAGKVTPSLPKRDSPEIDIHQITKMAKTIYIYVDDTDRLTYLEDTVMNSLTASELALFDHHIGSALPRVTVQGTQTMGRERLEQIMDYYSDHVWQIWDVTIDEANQQVTVRQRTVGQTGSGTVLGEKIGEQTGEPLSLGMGLPPMLGSFGILKGLSSAAAIQKILTYGKGAISIGGAALLLSTLIGKGASPTGTVSGNSIGIPGIDIDLGEISRAIGWSDLWQFGGKPEIPGEDILRYWSTGTTYFVETVAGRSYVLTKTGWKRYYKRRPIVLGTKHPTPSKLIRAVRKYKKLQSGLNKVFKVTRTRRTCKQ